MMRSWNIREAKRQSARNMSIRVVLAMTKFDLVKEIESYRGHYEGCESKAELQDMLVRHLDEDNDWEETWEVYRDYRLPSPILHEASVKTSQ